MSAYMLFGQHIRADIVKENPEIKASPIACAAPRRAAPRDRIPARSS
jgi:hypothetical protein